MVFDRPDIWFMRNPSAIFRICGYMFYRGLHINESLRDNDVYWPKSHGLLVIAEHLAR